MTKYRIVKETNTLGEEHWCVEEKGLLFWRRHTYNLAWLENKYMMFPSVEAARQHVFACMNEKLEKYNEKEHDRLKKTIVKREVVE